MRGTHYLCCFRLQFFELISHFGIVGSEVGHMPTWEWEMRRMYQHARLTSGPSPTLPLLLRALPLNRNSMDLCIADKEADIWLKSRMAIVLEQSVYCVWRAEAGHSPSNAAESFPLRRHSRSLWSEFVRGVSKNTYQNDRLHMFVSAAGVVASGIEDFDSAQCAPEGQPKFKPGR